MRTLLPDPPPPEIEALLERRRRIGADTHDEVWEGVLHMAPAAHGRHGQIQHQLAEVVGPLARDAGLIAIAEFNLGGPDDYRVPDGGLLQPGPAQLHYPTAALVLEVVSPGDESWEKLPFYAAHDVDELLFVDPDKRIVDWLVLAQGEYQRTERSALIELGPAELATRIEWPSAD
jgi:Uma2 family endonuclease